MLNEIVEIISLSALPLLILGILFAALCKRLPLYELFIDGAKDGVDMGLKMVPYLVGIITAVGMFRASGAMELIAQSLLGVLESCNIPVDVLPIMFTRSLSGSATLGLLPEVIEATGPNSYATKLAAVMVGSSETTFYVLAVYFGSVGIKKYRHALYAGILADIFGIVAAIVVCNLFFA